MENLHIKGSSESPTIDLNTNGNLSIKGVSLAHNQNVIFGPIHEWLLQFDEIEKNNISFEMDFEYLNTSSIKAMVDIIKKIDEYKIGNCNVTFIWKYNEEDEDILDIGKEIEYFSRTNFDFISYHE